MSVDFGFTTEGIEHVVPVNAHMPSLSKPLIDGQASIHRCAERLTIWSPVSIIYQLHAYLPRMRKIGGRGKTQ